MMETPCQSNGCNPKNALVNNNKTESRTTSAVSLKDTSQDRKVAPQMSSTQKTGRAKSKLARAQRTKEYRELRLAYLQGELGAPDAPNRAGMLFDAFWRGYFGEEREQQKRDEMIAFAAGRDSAAKEQAREDWAEDGVQGVTVTEYQRRIYNAVPKDRLADPGEIASKLGIDARRCGSALVALAEKGLLSRRERSSGDWGYRQK